ncbi:MAG: polysaccharide pyruvyl transferase family protein [Pseudomonadota bacterium]
MIDADRALALYMGSYIRAVGFKTKFGTAEPRWSPGKKLKLLLAGYVGSRNTGADVRVEEMIRQFRHILGDDRSELTIMSIDPTLTQGYFDGVRQIVLPQIFPKFLYDECPKHHGVVACEGSMFKSKFANALSTMMAGALGIAARENKLSVGYGAEAGAMTPPLRRFVGKHCRNSFVICRNEPSRKILEEMGIRTASGTDTAWTFEPSPPATAQEILRRKGWDGQTPILTLCPINPYWWPVKPRLLKAAARPFVPAYRAIHYKSIYFHEYPTEARKKYERYLDSIAEAVAVFHRERRFFPILVAMERLDRRACLDLQARLKMPMPIFGSDEYNMYDLVAILRKASFLVSSRFHAIVTSMPAQVPSAGITMDERIRNLMTDRGHPDLFLTVDDERLTERLVGILRKLDADGEKIREEIGRSIPKQLQLMGQMGVDFLDEVSRVYPDYPRRDLKRAWDLHLPPLPETVRKLMEKYA